MVTIRPKAENFTEDLVLSVKDYIVDKWQPDWHLIAMEKGNHLHCAMFLHEPQQRSNVITKFLNNPLKAYDDDEKKNFRRFDRASKTGAVLQLTTLGIVAEYLSGEFERKLEDEFEIISERLPEDISELEEYLPAVNGLKRKRQVSVWYSTLEAEFRAARPDVEVITEADALLFVQTKMFVSRDMDIIADQRILRQKIRSFVPYFNKEAIGYYTDYSRSTFPNSGIFPDLRGE